MILGLDISTTCTGWAAIEAGGRYVASGVIRPPSKAKLQQRLAFLFPAMQRIAICYKPHAVAIEDVHVRYANAAMALGVARGIVLAALLSELGADLPITDYAPATIKATVAGHGHASKAKVAAAVMRTLRVDTFASDDESDACAIALCHLEKSSAATRCTLAEILGM